MTYLQTHKRPYQERARTIGISVGALVLVLIVLQLFIPHFFPALFTSVARPFWRTEFSIQSGSLQSPEQLLNENESLKRQLTEAQVRLDTIQEVEAENTELKALFGRDKSQDSEVVIFSTSTTVQKKPVFTNPEKKILAAVLVRPPRSIYDELIIDIGRDHEVSTTSLVYAPGNVLIGRVTDVLGSTAKVRLFSSPHEKYQVSIGSSHTVATAVGRGGGQYEAQIPRDSSVNEGDYVTSPFLNDLAFGIVSTIISDPAQTFETVLFAPPVNIYQLRWVLVKN